MTAPANPPATSVTADVAALLAFIAANPTKGVYIYVDSAAVPTGAGIAASAVDTALLAAYEADARTIAAQRATDHVFATTSNLRVKVRANKTKVFSTTNQNGYPVARLDRGTVLYVKKITDIGTSGGRFHQILDGTYVNKYILIDDVELDAASN